MEYPFHSSIVDPTNGARRCFKCLITGNTYPYKKSSSTDGTDEKAAAMASLTAAQSSTITTLINGGYLQRKPLLTYTLNEVRDAYAESA